MLRSPWLNILAGFTIFALFGCSALIAPIRKAPGLSGQISLAVTIDPGANNDSPLAVDVLAIDDKKMLVELSAFTAHDWFLKRKDYLRLHPSAIKTYSWEWAPGEQIVSIKIPQTTRADGVLLFANYSGKGTHSTVLPKSGTVRIECGADDFKVLSAHE